MDVCCFKAQGGWRYITCGELGPHGDFQALSHLMLRRQWQRVKDFGYFFGRNMAHLSKESVRDAVAYFGPMFRETAYSPLWFQRLQEFDHVMASWCGTFDYGREIKDKLRLAPKEAAFYAPAGRFRGTVDIPKLVFTLEDFFKLMSYHVRIASDLFDAIKGLPKSRGGTK